MSLTQWREHFGSQRSGRIVLTRLFRAIILQAHREITAGREAPIQGNVRTFWYRFVKPVMARLPASHQPKSDPYELMGQVFVEMVCELGWMSYADFDFTDENWAHRFIGETSPHVLVFSEKRGWIRFVRRCHEDLGTSALTLGGMPSALTSEYTARALREVVDPSKTLYLLGIVDWDPSGDLIARTFESQLHTFGYPHTDLRLMIRPEHYAPRELEFATVALASGRGQAKKNELWMEAGGGVLGDELGIASESMPWDRLWERIREEVRWVG